MRKMIEESVRLTKLNMQDYRAGRNEIMKKKRERMERRFKKEILKQ